MDKTAPAKRAGLEVFLLTSALLVVIVVIYQAAYYPKRSRYTDVFDGLNQIYVEIHALTLKLEYIRIGEIEDKCQLIVNRLAKLLGERAGQICAVCIKTVIENRTETGKLRLEAVTLCRDDGSKGREHSTIRVAHHWIDENSDFDQLLKSDPPLGYWSFNNLPGLDGYKNSSFLAYKKGPPPETKITLLRKLFWNLPYQSTIVASISPKTVRNRQNEEIVGFLCVDSDKTGTFFTPADAFIVKGIADCLFEIVMQYNRLKKGLLTR
jgi:hypothetical protein